MRIELTGAERTQAPHATPASGESGTVRQNGQTAGPTDGVSLSGAAQEIRAFQRAALDAPEVREDLVADLKAKIAAGQYHPPAEDIARKMLGG
ncbi:MAG: flagellar biosynthesis anti-sigma factor FlgM [Dehalococcoidia bacterium]